MTNFGYLILADDFPYQLIGLLVVLIIGGIASAIKKAKEASGQQQRPAPPPPAPQQSQPAPQPRAQTMQRPAAPRPRQQTPARRRVILTGEQATGPTSAMPSVERHATEPIQLGTAEVPRHLRPEQAEQEVDQVGQQFGSGVLKGVQRMEQEVQAELTGEHRGAVRTAKMGIKLGQQAVSQSAVFKTLKLHSRSHLMQAIIYSEILGRPKSLRRDDASWDR